MKGVRCRFRVLIAATVLAAAGKQYGVSCHYYRAC